jgi:hypothetical protein
MIKRKVREPVFRAGKKTCCGQSGARLCQLAAQRLHYAASGVQGVSRLIRNASYGLWTVSPALS